MRSGGGAAEECHREGVTRSRGSGTRVQRWPAAGLAVVAAGACSAGCVTPLLHPLRASNGPVFELATSGTVTAGRRGTCGDAGCVETGERSVGLTSLQLSGGYSRVLARHFGVMAGAHVPAAKTYVVPIALWSFFTVQNEYVSAGAGPDLGVGGAGVTLGAELSPWGDALLHPRFGGYARWFWPFSPEPETIGGRARSWELGGRLRFGPIYLQYSFHTHPEGAALDHDEESFAQSRHMLSIGLTLDRETVRAFTSIGSGPAFRPPAGP